METYGAVQACNGIALTIKYVNDIWYFVDLCTQIEVLQKDAFCFKYQVCNAYCIISPNVF
jgi:hypothetical protein